MLYVGNNFFYTKSLPCTLWFLDKDKPQAIRDKVLFIDAQRYHTAVSTTLNEWTPWQLKNLSAIAARRRSTGSCWARTAQDALSWRSCLLGRLSSC